MPELTQDTLFGEVEQHYGTYTFPVGPLSRAIKLTRAVVDKARIQFDGDTLRTTMVDPSNVVMVDLTFDIGVTVDEPFTIGVDLGDLNRFVSGLPWDTDGGIQLDMGFPTTTVELRKGVDTQTWTVTDSLRLLDPDSIREEPEIPDLERETEADLHIPTLAQFMSGFAGDVIELDANSPAYLNIGTPGDTADYDVLAEIDTDGYFVGDGRALYLGDFIASIAYTLNGVGVDTARFTWDDEYPVSIEAETDEFTVEYLLAPRLES